MTINKYTLAGLFVIVLSALIYLLIIQFRILEKDIENNKHVMELALPDILSDMYDNLMFNEDLRKYTNAIQGTKDFNFTRTSKPIDPIQILLKAELDRVLSLNYPELDYELNGFASNEYGCMIHRHHRPEMPKAKKVLDAESHLCFCMILNNTLDVSLNYIDKEEAVIGKSSNMLRTSVLMILIIIAAFWYTIRTIQKQKKLSDLKRDFINNLTHEFKTPIFSISLAAKSLKAKEEIQSSAKMTSYVDLIGIETKRLQTQVDKILQMALIDSGNLTLDKKRIDLHASIADVLAGFELIINERSGQVTLNLNATNSIVLADQTHINNILYNLIDNAQKYSNGAPEIEIKTENDERVGLILSIKDHGIGMDDTTQRFVFDQFYRARQGDIHTVKGFGLGLSYVKRIIELHKGSIRLKSTLGLGSEFEIFLPQKS